MLPADGMGQTGRDSGFVVVVVKLFKDRQTKFIRIASLRDLF